MRLDDRRLLVRESLLLSLAQLLDQGHGAAGKAALEAPAGTGVHKLDELLVGKVQQLVEVDTAVLELLEGPLALQLSGSGSVVVIPVWSVSRPQ